MTWFVRFVFKSDPGSIVQAQSGEKVCVTVITAVLHIFLAPHGTKCPGDQNLTGDNVLMMQKQ